MQIVRNLQQRNALLFWLYDLVLQTSFRALLQNGHEPMTKAQEGSNKM
jgi:hypothetical protein